MKQPSGATGFTPVNGPGCFISKEPAFESPQQPLQSPQPGAENRDHDHDHDHDHAQVAHSNRPKRNPLVQEYLRPRRAGSHSSMFERAAISNGEKFSSRKRRKNNKGLKTVATQANRANQGIQEAKGTVSDTVSDNVTKPRRGSRKSKAQSNANVITQSATVDDSTTHNSRPSQISVLAPFTSMDRVAAGTDLGTTVYSGRSSLNNQHWNTVPLTTAQSYTIPSDPISDENLAGKGDISDDEFGSLDGQLTEQDFLQALEMSTAGSRDDFDEWFTTQEIDDALSEVKEQVEAIQPINETKKVQNGDISRKFSLSTPSPEAFSFPHIIGPRVRPPFPELVADCSPIVGLSSTLSMRTCFRVGEAIKASSQAIQEGAQVFIELYARVRSSFREPQGVKQHFVFMDIFHDHQPYLSGISQNWKGVELWDRESAKFLEPSNSPRMCRCMGQIKKENKTWKLTVFNIWEATMDDVEYVFGIINS